MTYYSSKTALHKYFKQHKSCLQSSHEHNILQLSTQGTCFCQQLNVLHLCCHGNITPISLFSRFIFSVYFIGHLRVTQLLKPTTVVTVFKWFQVLSFPHPVEKIHLPVIFFLHNINFFKWTVHINISACISVKKNLRFSQKAIFHLLSPISTCIILYIYYSI